ncbi:immunoglobulin alpha-2 heavy chain-like [Protopterus annectens]|uniref:immunoglobulin alpha-2 heavy chain-like n=1 Tax=Protopterus annectens TaxID=7888 RepID=UPI001CFA4B7C|nr:immunoglobulin alpha-2 heavy chain-like [Protopterus annectens]
MCLLYEMHSLFIMLGAILLLFVCFTVLMAQPVQLPHFVKVNIGQSVTLSCITERGSAYCYDMMWYVQYPMASFQQIISDRKYSTPSERLERNCSLTIRNVKANSTGMYFCSGCSIALNVFGNGTWLSVTDGSSHSPTLFIVRPLDNEMKLRNVTTLICMVCDIPFHSVMIYWNISGTITNGLMESRLSTMKGEYCMTNQITISAVTWNEGTNCTCIVENEPGIFFTKHIWKKDKTLGILARIPGAVSILVRIIIFLLFVIIILVTCLLTRIQLDSTVDLLIKGSQHS